MFDRRAGRILGRLHGLMNGNVRLNVVRWCDKCGCHAVITVVMTVTQCARVFMAGRTGAVDVDGRRVRDGHVAPAAAN